MFIVSMASLCKKATDGKLLRVCYCVLGSLICTCLIGKCSGFVMCKYNKKQGGFFQSNDNGVLVDSTDNIVNNF